MPSIGIIGAQNVGKSTLFNALIRKKKSITFDKPGVTVDMVSHRVDWGEGRWELTDFPGFEKEKALHDDRLGKASIQRALNSLDRYNLLIWVVSRRGLSPYEHELARLFRKLDQPVWLAVNHVDDPSLESQADEFYRLGFSEIVFISALNRRNIDLLRDKIVEYFGAKPVERVETPSVKLAIVGKPNAGKSTLFNTLLSKEISLVFDQPGTTRDAIEEQLRFGDHLLSLVDTAGLKRKKATLSSVEVFSEARTKKAIESADIVIHIINSVEGIDRQNKSILEWIEDVAKPAVIVLNKVDLLTPDEVKHLEDSVHEMKKRFWNFPAYYLTATQAKKTGKVLQKALLLYDMTREKIPTPGLNKLLAEINRSHVMVSHKIKFNYITQAYPQLKFILFGHQRPSSNNIVQFIRNAMQENLNWTEVPLKLDFRRRETPR